MICLEELLQGDTIARLPCLCIYHKRYERAGRASLAAPQTPEGSFPVGGGREGQTVTRHPVPQHSESRQRSAGGEFWTC